MRRTLFVPCAPSKAWAQPLAVGIEGEITDVGTNTAKIGYLNMSVQVPGFGHTVLGTGE